MQAEGWGMLSGLANTEDIKKQLTTQPQPSVTSWSQVAAAPPTPSNLNEDRRPSQSIETKRKELKVTVKGQQDREIIIKRST
jgi:hypothetical protein